MERIQAVRGVRDILPPETHTWTWVEEVARAVFQRFGYEEIRLPLFEETRLFARSIGESTDIVEKEMYTFQDRDGRWLTLRPEGTASVVRAFIEHHLDRKASLHRLYYLGPMFRRERPQAGRYRQFHQIGAELLGVAHPWGDAEILDLVRTFFEALGITPPPLSLNSLGCPVCRPAFREALVSYLQGLGARLCGDCKRRIRLNPLRVLDCKVPTCQEQVAQAPRTLDYLCEACQEHFQGLQEALGTLGIAYSVDPHLVRGLDYYTRTVFEFIHPDLGAQNTVAAGGRYDQLVESLGGPSIPAVGYSLGVERLIRLLEAQGRTRAPEGLQVFVAALGAAARRKALALTRRLRHEGIRTQMDPEGGSLKRQMRWADRLGARWVVILGEEELAQGAATLRDMETHQQDRVSLQKVVSELASRIQERARPR